MLDLVYSLIHRRVSIDRCTDYVQLYVDLERPEVAERATPSFTLCGTRSALTQTQYYSSQRSLILEFHAGTVQTNSTGFKGIYRFLDKGLRYFV